ncbi:hypothetical protein CB1_001255004 [Camelus ferus]|nr:hypothetical protein CB1_001255004 [Camelus ferus]
MERKVYESGAKSIRTYSFFEELVLSTEILDLNLKLSQLDASHPGLVRDCWKPGHSKRKLPYLQGCVQTLLVCYHTGHHRLHCVLTVDPTSEAGVAYSLDGYQGEDILRQLVAH